MYAFFDNRAASRAAGRLPMSAIYFRRFDASSRCWANSLRRFLRAGRWPVGRRAGNVCGSALIDVLLSLSIVATLAVTSTQIQLKQRRLQDLLAQRLQASALLDAWAEQLQMSLFAALSDPHAVRERAMAAADAAAASSLPNGRAYEHQIGDGFVELQIRWRAPWSSMRGTDLTALTSARFGHTSDGVEGGDEHVSESILALAP